MTEDASISGFPLAWPLGWTRTPAIRRKEGRFFVGKTNGRGGRAPTVADGVTRILDELKRMGVPDFQVVISTNVRPTLAGWPRSGEAQPDDPGVAIYWRDGAQRLARRRRGHVMDGAAEFRAMYVEHCAACREAGIPEPTIEQWIAHLEERIAERQEGLQGDDGALT